MIITNFLPCVILSPCIEQLLGLWNYNDSILLKYSINLVTIPVEKLSQMIFKYCGFNPW